MSLLRRLAFILVVLFSTFAVAVASYWICLSIPYTEKEFRSPYGNASIKIVMDGRLPFFSFNAGPVDGNFVLIHDDKVVDKLLRSECCYTNHIEDIKWYRDSVTFKYIVNFDIPKMVYDKAYYFEQEE
jgi:hypothetical protein